ncbi:hypothetical protein CAPTEDRAFT_229232 [Capitella teleta]|uniref:Hexosyltransferase n=1 Tax=Capitella teleta TaxID=283909 RepID=R7TSG9_CAPTE|nr:hypothetical protein CAPTEDRAFT_229232 [Capitella teleta]|eukprot:ELT94431.1 hypothetical protein CAPTEDRAFT_229232 [Capitella teleta]
MATSVVCQRDFHARMIASASEPRDTRALSTIHLVFIGAFLSFGLLSLCLGVFVLLRDGSAGVGRISRARRGLEGEVKVEDILPSVVLDSDSEIFVSILSDEARFQDYSLAIGETWGQGEIKYELLYGVERKGMLATPPEVRGLDVGSPFGYNHLLRSLQYACDIGHFDWQIMLMDSVYLNPSALRRVLALLSPSDNILMGVAFVDDPDVCDVSFGAVFSRSAMEKICPRLELSLSPAFSHLHSIDGASLALGRFLYEATGISCFDPTRIVPQFRASDQEAPITTHTVFIGPLTTLRSIQKTHALVIDLEIHALQDLIIQTKEELLRVSSRYQDDDRDPRPKRNSVWNQSDHLVPFQTLSMRTSSFSEYINRDGHLFKDACRMTSYDLIHDDRSSFLAARKLVSGVVNNEISFAYKDDKHRRGIEYNFYSVQAHKKNPAAQKVRQVSVQLSTGELHLVNKKPMQLQDIYIVTIIPEDHRHVGHYLRSLYEACERYANISESRCHVELFLHHKFSLLHQKHSSGYIIEHFRFQHPDFSLEYAEYNDPTFDYVMQTLSTKQKRNLHLFLPMDARVSVDFLLRSNFNTQIHERVYFPVALHSNPDGGDPVFWINKDFSTFSAYLSDILDFSNKIQDARDMHSLFRWAGFEISRRTDPGLTRDVGSQCSQNKRSDREMCMQELRMVNLA